MKEKIINFIVKFRWAIVILVPILSVLTFMSSMHKAGFETDWKIWFDEDSEIIKNYDHFKDSFGNDDMALVVIRNKKGIFNPAQIKNIQKITNLLWKTKKIARVDSITNFQHVYVNEEDKDEIIVQDLIPSDEKLSSEILKEKEKIALNEPDLVGRLISKDGKTTMIMARMVYSKQMDTKLIVKTNQDIEKIITDNSLDGVTYIQAGMPRYAKDFMDVIKSNMQIFVPLLLLCILVILALVFRNIWCVLLPILVIIFSLLITLGITFGIGYKLNTMSSMFPVFLIAIGIADSVHFMWLWIHSRQSGFDNKKAVLFSLNKNLLPAFLTSITTFFGFSTLGLSKIIPLQAFGAVTAIGVVIAFVISASFIPAFLLMLNPKVKAKKQKNENKIKFIENYTNFIIKHDKSIIAATTILIVFFVSGIKFASIDTDFLEQFSKESKMRQDVEFMEKNIGGTIPLEVIIDSKKEGGINEPEFLRKVEKFANEFKAKFQKISSNNSVINVLKRYEQLMHEGKASSYKIPDSKDLVSQYLLLYSLSLPQGMSMNTMFDVQKRYLRLTNMLDATSELEKIRMYKWTQHWWERAGYSATLEGATIISGFLRIELTNTMIKSILLAIAIVTFILFLTFRKRLYILASLAPNLLPLVMTIGLGGWLGINIDLGIAIVAVMIIGIAVDDTVHFLAKYQSARQNGEDVTQSLQTALLLSGNAIVITTLILVVGFGLFTLSDFAMYYNLGFVSSVALTSAMILDLAFLPALLHFLEKRKVS